VNLNEAKIIVTGAAQGIGFNFSKRLTKEGVSVAAGDVNEDGLAKLASECAQGKIFTRRLDVANEADTASFVDFAFEKMGGLNGLVNNAGILRDGLLVKLDKESGKVVKLTREQWQQVIDVNLTGATWMVRDTVAKMVENKQQGAIVNMSSIARYGNRGQSNYAAAKGALATNTKTWAQEFAKIGIRCGAVAPGMVETPMTQSMNQKARDALVAAIPVGRIGVPEDIWLAVKFVLECDYFNGRTMDVDGGLIM
jgi:3-oxoacyl-[acyl-carrier protein] reductase